MKRQWWHDADEVVGQIGRIASARYIARRPDSAPDGGPWTTSGTSGCGCTLTLLPTRPPSYTLVPCAEHSKPQA